MVFLRVVININYISCELAAKETKKYLGYPALRDVGSSKSYSVSVPRRDGG